MPRPRHPKVTSQTLLPRPRSSSSSIIDSPQPSNPSPLEHTQRESRSGRCHSDEVAGRCEGSSRRRWNRRKGDDDDWLRPRIPGQGCLCPRGRAGPCRHRRRRRTAWSSSLLGSGIGPCLRPILALRRRRCGTEEGWSWPVETGWRLKWARTGAAAVVVVVGAAGWVCVLRRRARPRTRGRRAERRTKLLRPAVPRPARLDGGRGDSPAAGGSRRWGSGGSDGRRHRWMRRDRCRPGRGDGDDRGSPAARHR